MPTSLIVCVIVTIVCLGLVSGSTPALGGLLRPRPVQPVLQPFPLSAVSLTPGSQEANAAELNAEYLRMIPIDSLLWTFRKNAGLPTPGTPLRKVTLYSLLCMSIGLAQCD